MDAGRRLRRFIERVTAMKSMKLRPSVALTAAVVAVAMNLGADVRPDWGPHVNKRRV
jgi:hypothetical protein